jgi:protein RecA
MSQGKSTVRRRLPPDFTADRPFVRAKLPVEGDALVGSYFTKPAANLQFISTGCQVLDCTIGGGYVLGRIVNIVGDKSTGKTLLAIEAMANFYHRYRNSGHCWYCETEAAFDNDYAAGLGIDIKRVLRPAKNVRTVEDFFEHLETAILNRGNMPGLYVLDSLDALSDAAETKRAFDDPATFGAQKAKKLSELFRRLVRIIEDSRVCVMIISQIRDNIGATFGKKYVRGGGKALDFYASQVIYLAHLGQIKRTRDKVERVTGVNIRAKVDKNKIGLPLRECEFPIRFGFGIDDVIANIEWLQSVGKLDSVRSLDGRNIKLLLLHLDELPRREYEELRIETQAAVRRVWSEIETRFMPSRSKYDDRDY